MSRDPQIRSARVLDEPVGCGQLGLVMPPPLSLPSFPVLAHQPHPPLQRLWVCAESYKMLLANLDKSSPHPSPRTLLPSEKAPKSSVESVPARAVHAPRIIGSYNSFTAKLGWQGGLNPVALREQHTLERVLFAFVNCKIKILPGQETPFWGGLSSFST